MQDFGLNLNLPHVLKVFNMNRLVLAAAVALMATTVSADVQAVPNQRPIAESRGTTTFVEGSGGYTSGPITYNSGESKCFN